MCLTVNTFEIKTAEKDIVVYKNLNNGESSMQRFTYKRFKHNFNIPIKLESTRFGVPRVNQGYHSFLTPQAYSYNSESTNSVFIIPKGTQYVEGFYNTTSIPNYVSSDIIYIGHSSDPITYIALFIRKIFKK